MEDNVPMERSDVSRRSLIGAASIVPFVLASKGLSVPQARNSLAIVDREYDSLEAALGATPVSGLLVISVRHVRSAPFKIDRPVTVRFIEQGEIVVSDPSVSAIEIAASSVHIEDAVLTGTGADRAGLGDGIRAVGTDEVLATLRISRPRIHEFAHNGILIENATGVHVSDVDVRACGYAGIMLLSVSNASVSRGVIADIRQPRGYVNSYGVAVSRRSTGKITGDAPRSKNVIVEGLTIDGVPNWEGLDTHAGENITFRGNSVSNTRTGIAIVGSKGESGDGVVYAPLNCSVLDNVVTSGTTAGTADRAIVFAGAAGVIGNPLELATGRVAGNVVRDFGSDASTAGTSIQLVGTAGVSVVDNTIINSARSAIDFYHDNYGAKASGNTIIDVWSDKSEICAAIQMSSTYNKVSISGTTIVRMTKRAAKVNERGLDVRSSPTNTVLDGGGNDWAAAVVASTLGDDVVSESRSFATNIGFYGVSAAPQAAAIPSPQPEVVALKGAVDSIRTALAAIGVTE